MSRVISNRFVDPQVLSRISNLQLVAKTVVEGFLTGLHRSPYHGFSLDFAEYREYSPGDDIRHVDWKVYGRSDRIYVKKYEGDTNTQLYLLLAIGDLGDDGGNNGTGRLAWPIGIKGPRNHYWQTKR